MKIFCLFYGIPVFLMLSCSLGSYAAESSVQTEHADIAKLAVIAPEVTELHGADEMNHVKEMTPGIESLRDWQAGAVERDKRPIWPEQFPYNPNLASLHDAATKIVVETDKAQSQEVINLPRETPKCISDKDALTYWQLFEYPGSDFYVAGAQYKPKTFSASNIIGACARGMFSHQDYQAAGHIIRGIYGCDLTPFWKYQGLKFPLALTRKTRFPTSPFAGQGSLGSMQSSSIGNLANQESTPVAESILRCQYSAVAQMCFAEVFFLPCLEQTVQHIKTLPAQEAYDVKTDLIEFVTEYCTTYTNDVLECPKRFKEVSTLSNVSWATDHCKSILTYLESIEEERKNKPTEYDVEKMELPNKFIHHNIIEY